MEGMLLKPEQAAKALGIGRTKLYDILRSGQLRSVQIGGSRRISIKAIEAYIDSLEEAASSSATGAHLPRRQELRALGDGPLNRHGASSVIQPLCDIGRST